MVSKYLFRSSVVVCQSSRQGSVSAFGASLLMLLKATTGLAVVATVTSVDCDVFPCEVALLDTSLDVSCSTRFATEDD